MLWLLAYDAGLAPPPRPAGSVGLELQHLDSRATAAAVADRISARCRCDAEVRRRIRGVLDWLAGFGGDTWEERWLASGADAAPRVWHSGPRARSLDFPAVTALLVAGVLRPSYAWQLGSRMGMHFEAKVLDVLDPASAAALRALPAYQRALPAYQRALPRHQVDAERALARVMVRTGRRLDQLQGEHLLHYADVIKTSGRQRREHLAWELLVALGPFAAEPVTLRAAWTAKGNTCRHTTATLVDRCGIPPSGVRDLLVDYLGEISAGMDYSSLEGLAYRLARLFWWELLQLNPAQQDLRLTPQLAAAWRDRLAVTTDGKPRRETHSILFAVRALYGDLAE